MSLVVTIDGVPVTHDFAPSGLNITHRADGEAAAGGIPFEDPDGTLTIVGHRPVTVEEDACAQPRLFTGWTTQRDIGRAYDEALIVDEARIVDTTLVDLNSCLAWRQITGSDGNRPAETWAARLTWILGSDYLSEWISADETWIVTNTVSIEAADYRGSYPSAVLDDLADRSGGAYIYFVFWDAVASEVRLFFDNDVEVIGACSLSISNVIADVDYADVFPPDDVARLAREPDQTYSDVEVVYDRGAKKLYRYRPSTATTYVRRGTTIARPYTRGLATATAQAEAWLDKHSVETDRITCTIKVPAASVGLIQAGQSIQARFSHLGLPYSAAGGATMRIVSCSPKPTDDLAAYYDIALELVYRPVVSIEGGCYQDSMEFMEDDAWTGEWHSSPETVVIGSTPSDTPAVIIAGFFIYDSADYMANEVWCDAPWTLLDTEADGTDMTYRRSATATAYYAWTSGAVPDLVWEWTGVFQRAADIGITKTCAIITGATAPVQTEWSGGTSIVLGAAPTEGNILVMYMIGSGAGDGPVAGWTLLSTTENQMDVFVRCVGPAESATIIVPSRVGYWYVSEWEITGAADTTIDLGPAPATTPPGTYPNTTDPTVNDDGAAGYGVGSVWVNTTSDSAWILTDSTTGAAVWSITTAASGAPTTADYLVGTAQAGLSAEIVVGTTPGGELGGTWASPTVDATHAGSTHLALGSTSSTAAAGDHTHAATGTGELLITDTPGSPLVFDDILQNDAGDALLYADA